MGAEEESISISHKAFQVPGPCLQQSGQAGLVE